MYQTKEETYEKEGNQHYYGHCIICNGNDRMWKQPGNNNRRNCSGEYRAGSLTTKFTIAKANQSLKIKSPKKKMKVGAKAKIKIKANKGHGKVTYKVSNKKIAKIKKGKLVALKKGKVKLTVTLKATKNYNQKKVTITIKVK